MKADLLPAAIMTMAVTILFLIRPLVERLAARKAAKSNFVVFEANPIHVPLLKADMEAAGWSLALSAPAKQDSLLCRFDKRSQSSVSLDRLLYENGMMSRTMNRQEGADLLIKVAQHGRT